MQPRDHVLLLFRQRTDWTVNRIARALHVAPVLAHDTVRGLARDGHVNLRPSGSDTAVELTSAGRAALNDLVGRRDSLRRGG